MKKGRGTVIPSHEFVPGEKVHKSKAERKRAAREFEREYMSEAVLSLVPCRGCGARIAAIVEMLPTELRDRYDIGIEVHAHHRWEGDVLVMTSKADLGLQATRMDVSQWATVSIRCVCGHLTEVGTEALQALARAANMRGEQPANG